MSPLDVLALCAGIVIVLATTGSVLKTLVLPRGLASRISVVVGRVVVRRAFLTLSRFIRDYETKDQVLSAAAPTALLAVLIAWLCLFLAGYALIFWSLVHVSWADAITETGSSMFTLGFATTPRRPAAAVDFLAAATGLLTIALQIAYLPVIYAAFNRRETLVTLLQSRAGSPAWGPEILARHQLVDIVDNLPEFYAAWETWSADVAESHATYPVLVWFRSPHAYRSWVLALLAVLDSAAMYLSLAPGRAPSEVRLCLRMGFTCLRDIARALQMPFDEDPFPGDPIELTFEEFQAGVERLQVMGFPIERTAEEAWPHFHGWRVNYESIAYRLADAVVAPHGPWSGPRTHLAGGVVAPRRPPDRTPEDPLDERKRAGRPRRR